MVRYVGKVVVPYERKRVWDVMADWTNLSKWDLNISRSERVPDQPKPDSVGTKFDCTFEASGRKSDVDYVIKQYDPVNMDRAQFEGIANFIGPLGFRSQDTLMFKDGDTPGSTEITAEFDLKFRGLFTPLSFVMGGTMAETGPKVMKNIESFVAEKLG